jgi:hypothetical protein
MSGQNRVTARDLLKLYYGNDTGECPESLKRVPVNPWVLGWFFDWDDEDGK